MKKSLARLLCHKSQVTMFMVIALILGGCHHSDRKYQGYVEGEDIYLASPSAGNLIKICVERGQRVKKGQFLFQLDPNPQQLLIREAKAVYRQAQHILHDLQLPKRKNEQESIKEQIAQADAQLQLATMRVQRNQTLYDKHVLDKDTLDASIERQKELIHLKEQFQFNLNLAMQGARPEQINAQKAQLSSLNIKLEEAQWELDQKTGYAPDDGQVFDVYYRKGEFVSAQRPVLSLLTPSNTRIEFFVPLDDLPLLHVGGKIQFTDEMLKHNGSATISYISPEAEYAPPLVYSRENSQKLVFRVKASIDDAQQAVPGQPVIVYLIGRS